MLYVKSDDAPILDAQYSYHRGPKCLPPVKKRNAVMYKHIPEGKQNAIRIASGYPGDLHRQRTHLRYTLDPVAPLNLTIYHLTLAL